MTDDKLAGALPTPTLTATLVKVGIDAPKEATGYFVIHDANGRWGTPVCAYERRLPGRRPVHCSACGAVGHSRRSQHCPNKP